MHDSWSITTFYKVIRCYHIGIFTKGISTGNTLTFLYLCCQKLAIKFCPHLGYQVIIISVIISSSYY